MNIKWHVKKLGDLCQISTGKTNSNESVLDGAYALFDRSKIIKRSNKYLFDTEALIIPGEGSEFYPRYYKGKFDLHQRAYALFNFDKDINIRYIEYFLIFDHEYFQRVAVGTTAKSLRLRHFQDIVIPTPPIEEQHRIVKILDEVFEKIERARENVARNIENVKTVFFKSLNYEFDNIADGKSYVLEEVCSISSKLVDPRQDEYLDLLHVGAGNIESKTGELHDLLRAKEEKLISGKFFFDDTMVLYSKIRPYLMKVVRPDFSGICSADIYPLKPNSQIILRDFLFYMLLSSRFTEYAILGSGRAGMPKVNREHLFNYSLNCPSIEMQEIIVHKLNELSNKSRYLENIYTKQITKLEGLKKNILKQAFNGEL